MLSDLHARERGEGGEPSFGLLVDCVVKLLQLCKKDERRSFTGTVV